MPDWRSAVRAHLEGAQLDPAHAIDIAEELAQHLEDRYEALKRAGVEDAQAARMALAELGEANFLVQELTQSAHDRKRGNDANHGETALGAPASRVGLRGLWPDLRYAARTLRRNPWFTATAVLCLALGIGATSTVFAVVDTLFLRPPPGIGEPNGIVRPYLALQTDLLAISGRSAALPYPLYDELRGRARSIEGLAGFDSLPVSVGLGPDASPADALRVTTDYFSVLHVQPALGRFFAAEESSPVVVVSHAYWRRALGADPSAVGKALTLNGHPFTIIGVAPFGFRGIDFETPSFWVPVSRSAELGLGDPKAASFLALTPVARLAAGFTAAEAKTELEPLMLRALREEYGVNTEARLELGPLLAARGPYPSQQALITRWLALAAGLVLAIACANTANLLLTRAVIRRKEIAIRLSMGARRARLVRQLLTENALLAAGGTVLGLLLAHWGVRLVPLGGLPPISVFTDVRVLLFAVAVTIVSVAVFGALPALTATRTDLAAAMKSSAYGAAHGGARALNALMVTQVALGTLLLVGAGLFVHSLRNLQAIDSGMDLENLLMVSVDLRNTGYGNDNGAATGFFERARERVRRIPGVREATIASIPPLSGIFRTRPYAVADSASDDATLPAKPSPMPQRSAIAVVTGVGPRYFATVGTPMLAGRDFDEQDWEGAARVVIVNRAFAERDWPDKSALGRCIDIAVDMADWGNLTCYRVIGVAADAKYEDLEEPRRAAFFVPLKQDPLNQEPPSSAQLWLLVRTARETVGIVGGVRSALGELDPSLPYVDVRPVSEQLARFLGPPRLGASIFSALGMLALVLAAIGLYGVVSYAVEQRRHEVGIRMALGARERDVLALVVRKGMLLTLAGLAIGMLCSLGAARLIAHLLHGVRAEDPLAFLAAGVSFAAIGMLASFVPARRAARLDPAVTLRNE